MQSMEPLSSLSPDASDPVCPWILHLLHDHNYKIAVITNGTSDMSYHHDLDSIIDVFVNPELCGDSKPSVIPYHRVGSIRFIFLLGHGKRGCI